MAVAQAWCVSTPGAMMAIGVPVTRREEGTLAFNAHRIYSASNYPYLVIRHNQQTHFRKKCSQMTNWKYEWSPEKYSVSPSGEENDWKYQPLYVFSKV